MKFYRSARRMTTSYSARLIRSDVHAILIDLTCGCRHRRLEEYRKRDSGSLVLCDELCFEDSSVGAAISVTYGFETC